ncbi:MAG: phosphate ABC transporter permease PstA [Planctomycetaceae bacterium]|nr:phosphate ABC transporter permease PstA [Planctomycetaceae bacterium]
MSRPRRFVTLSFGFIAWGSAVLVMGLFVALLWDVFAQGMPLVSWDFLTTFPQDGGRGGGIGPILISTAGILLVCLAVSIPLGVATAMLLAEFTTENPRLGRWVSRSLDVLAGVPSVVFGLFGNALFCRSLGLGVSILSGGLTLACMVLPFLIRATEEGLRSVSHSHRLAAAALGFSKMSTLFSVVLPLAAPGVIVGVVLGLGRALAETAALLFTSGYVPRLPTSFLDSGRMLSVHIYDLAMNVPGGNRPAYASALVLVGLLLLINMAANGLMSYFLRRHITFL